MLKNEKIVYLDNKDLANVQDGYNRLASGVRRAAGIFVHYAPNTAWNIGHGATSSIIDFGNGFNHR
ncbi:MAG: hypothetical protein ABF804_01300 [Liquorilactobacillus ghanensis]|uniref:hypothetical protein n=1 Tax=Liquorilactobacillus ghanensis TaxID=399370 RepID=UPI0039EAE513